MPHPRPLIAGAVAFTVAAGGIGVASWVLPQARIDAPQQASSATIPAAQAPDTLVEIASPVQVTESGQAAEAIGGVLKRLPQLLPQWEGVALQSQRFTSPVPMRCSEKDNGLYQARTWFAQRPGQPGAMSVSVIVSGPGYGQYLNSWLSRQLVRCGARFLEASPSTTKAQVDGVNVSGWVRGDVLVTVSADSRLAGELESVTAVVDSAVLDELGDVCADLDPSNAEERNPYLGSAFEGLLARVGIAGSPATEFNLPAPLPTPTWEGPSPRPFPELAIPLAVDPADVGQTTAPNLDELTQNEALTGPLLVDPDEVEPPEVEQTSPPSEPERPKLSVLGGGADVRVPDMTGPGCGWAFLGLEVPELNEEISKREAQEALNESAENAAAALFEQLIAQARYQEAWANYQEAAYQWAMFKQYQEVLDRSLAELEQARRDWEAAIEAMTRPEPEPSPEVTVSPNPTGTPSPTPSPTSTTAPTPAPTPTPSDPSPRPSSPTSSPTQSLSEQP